MDTKIILPSQPRVVSEEGDKGVYEIDGLYPGYGPTLGNSLRRILLSSLPGAAVTRVRIEGVAHEFSTLPGVKEDVIAILLNIKKLRFRMVSDAPQTVSLKAKGSKIFKAKDLNVPGQIEVANPDQVIVTLTEKDAALAIDFTVERGLGYVSRSALSREKAAIGEIILDAFFTPVRRVNYEVEDMRIGDRTDFNRLRLTIQTDDTITPHEALEGAIRIMIEQLKAIVGFQEPEAEVVVTAPESVESQVGEAASADAEDKNKIRVEELDIPARVANALSEASIRTVGGLIRRSSDDLKAIEGIGEKAVDEINKALEKLGLSLKS
ncbi:MAG: DNA-directed RNA polymerase subunit alpha [Candidatus Niyogibacteria bacterium]|nr:DNA-directed RNA polymerase subunit alpha [Candidatus Niyogibacteria bacterium]